MSSTFSSEPVIVNSDKVKYTEEEIISQYEYSITKVDENNVVTPATEKMVFKTKRKVPKLGVMMVGWGGNNGSTVTAGILANKHNITWQTKDGVHSPDYFGSLTQASTVRLGTNARTGQAAYIPFNNLLPMVCICIFLSHIIKFIVRYHFHIFLEH